MGGHLAAAKVLCKAGVDLDKANNDGATAIYVSAQEGHAHILQALLMAGASVAAATFAGMTPLHAAAQEGHLACVKVLAEIYPAPDTWRMFLLGSGAHSEVATINHLPILYKPDIIKYIWSFVHKPRYVDLAQLNDNGQTALQVANRFDKEDVAALLRSLSLSPSNQEMTMEQNGNGTFSVAL